MWVFIFHLKNGFLTFVLEGTEGKERKELWEVKC